MTPWVKIHFRTVTKKKANTTAEPSCCWKSGCLQILQLKDSKDIASFRVFSTRQRQLRLHWHGSDKFEVQFMTEALAWAFEAHHLQSRSNQSTNHKGPRWSLLMSLVFAGLARLVSSASFRPSWAILHDFSRSHSDRKNMKRLLRCRTISHYKIPASSRHLRTKPFKVLANKCWPKQHLDLSRHLLQALIANLEVYRCAVMLTWNQCKSSKGTLGVIVSLLLSVLALLISNTDKA